MNWHFTAFVVNVVIINVYLAYLNQSLINNTYSEMESLNLIAYPSKNVNALELCWRFSFSIVKIYFHHRLPLFLHLQSSEHRFVFARKGEQSSDFPFSLLLLSRSRFCHPTCQPRHSRLLGVGEVSNTTVRQHSHSERCCTCDWDPVSPAVHSLKPGLLKRDQLSYT